ncbi:MAG TPA: hypothetical protein VGE46_00085 [Bdellovibrio sp.]
MDLSIKTTLGIISFVTLTSVTAHGADVVYVPDFCKPELLTLTVTNKTATAQRLWTQVRFDQEVQETDYDVDAKAQIKILGTQFLRTAMAFSIKSWTANSLQIHASCEGGLSFLLSSVTSPTASHVLPAGTRTVKMHLLNLYLKSNAIHLKAFAASGAVLGEKSLQIENYYDTHTLKWSFAEDVRKIEIVGEARLSSLLFYDADGEFKNSPASFTTAPLTVDTTKTYFLVSTKTGRPDEAFVIALDDPAKIATAREQIKNPSLEKIIVAGIELGHGGFNRAFLARDKSPYSWSVNRVDAFADFAHISCDGSPDLTEERLLQKLNEGGRICFWRYRVVRELKPTEINAGRLLP